MILLTPAIAARRVCDRFVNNGRVSISVDGTVMLTHLTGFFFVRNRFWRRTVHNRQLRGRAAARGFPVTKGSPGPALRSLSARWCGW
ncbi:hypothetical protein Lesp01_34970 [Lentzea sp. NBRC 102530]|nr:hypothetical protein Lesp01_34970 [Lentzea sp. NBRC 102530]